MMTISKRQKIKRIILIVVLGFSFFFLGENTGMLIFNIFWQVQVAIGLVQVIKVNRIIRRGNVVKGKLVKFEKRYEGGNDGFLYQGEVEFSLPENVNSFVVTGRLTEVDGSKEYLVYVDEVDPSSSIIADSIKSNRVASALILSILFVLLFYVDYVLIKGLL